MLLGDGQPGAILLKALAALTGGEKRRGNSCEACGLW